MTVDEVVDELRTLGNPKVRAMSHRQGVGDHQFGVQMGQLRAIAKRIKVDHPLALSLWETGIFEAMLLSTLLMSPKQICHDDVDRMMAGVPTSQVADWFISYVIKLHPSKEALRTKWMQSEQAMCARAGWSLTTERVSKNPEGLDLSGLLDRIELEMGSAPEVSQWTMNYCLAEIGIRYPEHRERAILIGETLGVYRDFPTSKGCTSPFAPTWINAIVNRQS